MECSVLEPPGVCGWSNVTSERALHLSALVLLCKRCLRSLPELLWHDTLPVSTKFFI